MPKKNTTIETAIEKPAENNNTATTPPINSPVKSLVDHVDQIKDGLKAALRDLNAMVDMVRQAEREKRTTEREIEAVRAKLRQIQNVSI